VADILLKQNRDKSIKRKHPWIFSGAVQKIYGDPSLGETVKIISAEGEELGFAAYSSISSISARMWNFNTEQKINSEFFFGKMRVAINLRNELNLINPLNNACRLIYGENDGLPGFIVDKYADVLVVQILSAGSEYWKEKLIEILNKITSAKTIFERSDVEVRKLEGLESKKDILVGELNKNPIEILENGYKFNVDVVNGQKTGFYLDQRENRKAIQKYINNRDVLNCFSYSGGFTVYALGAEAKHVTSIDSSFEAIEQAKINVSKNQLSEDKNTWIVGDVFKELRLFRDKGMSFDNIILDPPKFAPTAAQVRSASRGYKDINLLAFKLLKPGGILMTFSCSGGLDRLLFQKIIADAAIDAGVNAQILEVLSQGKDHPIHLSFPEGAYLKGLICRI
jgi:23S rRNA (cytosine1962-C5)-methyltransferase